MNLQENFLTINPYSRCGEKLQSVKNIVIHWVGNAGSSAMGNRNYFESLKDKGIYASSQYIVGLSGEIIACMPENEIAWHSGNYNVNLNSIGIEVCHPDWIGKYSDITYNALIELIVDICKRHNLDQNSIIRHYDVTGKNCPKYYVENPSEFEKIKSDVANALGGSYNPVVPEVIVPTTPDSSCDVYKITKQGVNKRSGASLNSSVVAVLGLNTEFNVYGTENDFYKTDNGYVRFGYATKVSNGTVPSVNNIDRYRINKQGVNVRQRADLNSPKVTIWALGTEFNVYNIENDFYKTDIGYVKVGFADKISSGTPVQPSQPVGFKVGQRVTLQGYATQYATGQDIPKKYLNKQYTIMQVGNGKVLLKEIMSWVLNQDIK